MLPKDTKCVVCGYILVGDELGDDAGGPDVPRVCMRCFHCPKCKKEGLSYEHEGEGLLVICEDELCGFVYTVKAFEKALIKAANKVVCPHCKGIGFIPGPKKWSKG